MVQTLGGGGRRPGQFKSIYNFHKDITNLHHYTLYNTQQQILEIFNEFSSQNIVRLRKLLIKLKYK